MGKGGGGGGGMGPALPKMGVAMGGSRVGGMDAHIGDATQL